MSDLPALIRSWRTYRAMAAMDGMPTKHYEQLVDFFAMMIRWRLGR